MLRGAPDQKFAKHDIWYNRAYVCSRLEGNQDQTHVLLASIEKIQDTLLICKFCYTYHSYDANCGMYQRVIKEEWGLLILRLTARRIIVLFGQVHSEIAE